MKTCTATACVLILAMPPLASAVGVQAPPTRQGGDTMETAVVIAALPFTTTGTTTGYTDDYDEVCPTDGMGPDVVYAYTAPADQLIDIDLCGSAYDTKVFVYGDDFQLIACNDDYYLDALCGIYTSKIEGASLAAGGTYYIIVDGYGVDHGEYDLAVTMHSQCALTCPAGGVAEGEPALQESYLDSFNGGCDYSQFTPAFRVLTGGANGDFVLCGTSGWYTHLQMNRRDSDWFILFMGPTGTIEVTFEAEVASEVAELFPQHCDPGLAQVAIAGCEPGAMTITGYAPGDMVWFRVSPTASDPPSWIDDEYDYVIRFTGLSASVATESTTWSTVKALYE